MRAGRPSRTAEATAALRAIHQSFDSEPKILDDPFAVRFLSPLSRYFLTRLPGSRRYLERLALGSFGAARPAVGVRRIRAQVLVRSRYAEDRLEDLIDRGISQCVLLAAGLDSFALRRRDLAEQVQILEVDHPDTQQWKQGQLDRLGIERPSNLEFVACDFERQSLSEALSASRCYDPQRAAFFSWLGVTYYLTEAAIGETFRFLSEQAADSEIVFDYWAEDGSVAPTDRALLRLVRGLVAGQGERMLSFFKPEQMRALLERSGLKVEEDVDGALADERYLTGRRDGLRMPEFAHLLTASVSH